MTQEQTYKSASEELNRIVSELENGVAIDDLMGKVTRATDLIKFLKGKLTSTEAEVNQALEELNESSTSVRTEVPGAGTDLSAFVPNSHSSFNLGEPVDDLPF